jgi:tetratricopeptide (TPR) repeat protein
MQNLKRIHLTFIFLFVAAISVRGLGLTAQAPSIQARENPSARAKDMCPVRSTSMNAGDIALARDEYDKAIDFYAAGMGLAGPEGARAHNALIRALLAANRIDEAEANAKAWAATSPSDSWGRTSLGEVQLRKGEIRAALATLQAALAGDSCNARTRADLARLYELAGMFAAAKKMLDSAHALDSVDDEIEWQWIFSEAPKAQIEELEKYLHRSASLLTGERKNELVQRQKRLGLAFTDTCRMTTPIRSTTIPYYLVQNGPTARIFWSLQVTIDGKNLRLSEDSTISGILLKKSVAEETHLQPVADVEVDGIGSQAAVTAAVARAKSIRIGALEFQNCDVQVAKDDLKVYGETAWEKVHDAYLERGSDGLIGPDAFRDFLLTLDKPGREFRLDPLPEPPGAAGDPAVRRLVTGVAPPAEPLHDRYIDPAMKDWTKGFRSGQFVLFPLRLNEGPEGIYSFATNSSLNSVSLETAGQVVNVGRKGAELPSMSGHNGQFFKTSEVTLHFLGVKELVDGMAAMDTTVWSHNHGVGLTGFLGAPMLDQFALHLDYRDNLIRIDYDPKRIAHCPPNLKLPSCY